MPDLDVQLTLDTDLHLQNGRETWTAALVDVADRAPIYRGHGASQVGALIDLAHELGRVIEEGA